MATRGPNRRRRWEAAIELLLQEPNISLQAVAAKLGVSYSSVKGWQRLPEYQEMERAARREILARTATQLIASRTQAVETLRRALVSGELAIELRAALAILALGLKSVETVDVLQEIETLKQQVAKSRNTGCGDYSRAMPTANGH